MASIARQVLKDHRPAQSCWPSHLPGRLGQQPHRAPSPMTACVSRGTGARLPSRCLPRYFCQVRGVNEMRRRSVNPQTLLYYPATVKIPLATLGRQAKRTNAIPRPFNEICHEIRQFSSVTRCADPIDRTAAEEPTAAARAQIDQLSGRIRRRDNPMSSTTMTTAMEGEPSTAVSSISARTPKVFDSGRWREQQTCPCHGHPATQVLRRSRSKAQGALAIRRSRIVEWKLLRRAWAPSPRRQGPGRSPTGRRMLRAQSSTPSDLVGTARRKRDRLCTP